MKNYSLNLFFDAYPDRDFLDDLSAIAGIEEGEITKLIDLVLDWYVMESIDEEWDKWSKSIVDETELKKKKAIIRIFIFICKEYSSGKLTDEELKEDFENLGFDLNHFNRIVKKLKDNTEFRKEASKGKKPYENSLRNLDWRIDERKYLDGIKERIAVVEFVSSIKGEKEVFQLDFSAKSLKHLISLLNKIEKEM